MSYVRGLLFTILCDGLRDLLFSLWFAARTSRRRDVAVRCPDGGAMMLHFFDPPPPPAAAATSAARRPLVLLLHGLSGDGLDAYAFELIRALRAGGADVVSSTRRGACAFQRAFRRRAARCVRVVHSFSVHLRRLARSFGVARLIWMAAGGAHALRGAVAADGSDF